MGAATAQVVNNRLPDGRAIRALEAANGKRTFRQAEIFTIVRALVPAHETVMDVKDHDVSIQTGAYSSVNANGWWRTRRYGVYPRGFEKEFDKPVGEKIVWVEEIDGRKADFTFKVPDVPHPSVKDNGLRQATGMLDFDFEKLQYNEERRVVSVVGDFNPETDVRVLDVMRPREWALVDTDGYPLRSQPSSSRVPEARFMYVKNSDEFEKGATGWHGSVARGVDDVDGGRGVGAVGVWSVASGVAIVGRSAAAPLVEVPEEKLVSVADPQALLQRATKLRELAEDHTRRFGDLFTQEAHAKFIQPILDEAAFLTELAGKIQAIQKQS